MVVLTRRLVVMVCALMCIFILSTLVCLTIIIARPQPTRVYQTMGTSGAPQAQDWTYRVGARTYGLGSCARYTGVGIVDCQIRLAAQEWGQSAYWLRKVLYCESNLRPDAYNPYSGTQGIAQFAQQTFWGNVRRLRWAQGTWISPYNSRVATRLMAAMWRWGMASSWSCSFLVGYLSYGDAPLIHSHPSP